MKLFLFLFDIQNNYQNNMDATMINHLFSSLYWKKVFSTSLCKGMRNRLGINDFIITG